MKVFTTPWYSGVDLPKAMKQRATHQTKACPKYKEIDENSEVTPACRLQPLTNIHTTNTMPNNTNKIIGAWHYCKQQLSEGALSSQMLGYGNRLCINALPCVHLLCPNSAATHYSWPTSLQRTVHTCIHADAVIAYFTPTSTQMP
jgi:hypothetical protein